MKLSLALCGFSTLVSVVTSAAVATKRGLNESAEHDLHPHPPRYCAPTVTCYKDEDCWLRPECIAVAPDPLSIFCGTLFWPHSCYVW
ncbi:hypothetical protein I7I50_03939 [Histoplasma capsulatum G186AR]|uniref:Uncharacterized protein n=1 Tax=Ajellomyces capsulatus TaxID=5037 RepID=A0A8H8CYM4_AJECA|nr:hypothetical protein I7I52_04847 [Histoplasma capsulatum]QSS74959.1 hypothetical protein I7I50_03939 [Histoplasma capsulatum G186AR]